MKFCSRRRFFSFSTSSLVCVAGMIGFISPLFAAAQRSSFHVSNDTLALSHASGQDGKKVAVAIIDSGVDNEHPVLANHMWMNPEEIAANSRDDDRNAYVDDIFGWNFAERNNSIIDRRYLGQFSEIPYRFFELQAKLLLGTATPEELAWMKSTVADKKNMKELQKFGNFVHGTHVAGIVSSQAANAEIMALKIIPTEVKLPFQKNLQKLAAEHGIEFPLSAQAEPEAPKKAREVLLKGLLFALAQAQGLIMADVGKYLHRQDIAVANGSFGVSSRSARSILVPLLKISLGREATEAELEFYGDYFVAKVVQSQSILADASKNTLYVFAAGNDGSDNDQHPASPANIKRDNVIAVAATIGTQKLAIFSNFGENTVDVAAPGTIIRSSIPGNAYLALSGTSQASPFVAGVAAAVRSENPGLSPKQTKEILIKTVEKFDFLVNKVSSGGIVNRERAILAAKLSLEMPLEDAIKESEQIFPQGSMPRSDWNLSSAHDLALASSSVPLILPLPFPFQ